MVQMCGALGKKKNRCINVEEIELKLRELQTLSAFPIQHLAVSDRQELINNVTATV